MREEAKILISVWRNFPQPTALAALGQWMPFDVAQGRRTASPSSWGA